MLWPILLLFQALLPFPKKTDVPEISNSILTPPLCKILCMRQMVLMTLYDTLNQAVEAVKN